MAGLALGAGTSRAGAQTQAYQGKLTIGVCEADSRTTTDINARYSVGHWTGWLGWYGPQGEVRQSRAGLEYDLRRPHLTLLPSLQVASAWFAGGSIYSEIGGPAYLIAGVSRTDLKPYINLTFDPNESWQLGGGFRFGAADSLAAFTIWDNRLHTGQQNTHAVLRHYLGQTHRLTLDASYKSGRGDEGIYVRGGAVTAEFDWFRWFVKIAGDEHVNFTPATMWRVGGGFRF
jgi:hypothetical protein